jgi:hypothetical protein
MDDDLKHKFAPRRNKRHPHLRDHNEQAAWARGLDWHNNDCHFHTLVQDILDHLDDFFREDFGLRLDQLADREELLADARAIRAQYQQNPEFHSNLGFGIYLHVSLKYPLLNRAYSALEKRREQVENFAMPPRPAAVTRLPSPPPT